MWEWPGIPAAAARLGHHRSVPDEKRTQRWRHAVQGDDPGDQKPVALVLPLTLASLIVVPLFVDFAWGATASVLIIGLCALFALRRSGTRRSVRHVARAIVVATTLVASGSSLAADSVESNAFRAVSLCLFALLLLLTPTVMILRLLTRPRITLDTVAGALAAYLQVGIFFATVYRLTDVLSDGQFFTQTSKPTAAVFQYFSFITLTTVGYGDYTPAGTAGQLLATLEAVLGQLFLVTVVSLVVGNLGRDIPRRMARAQAGDPPADPPEAGDAGSGRPED